MTVICTIHVQEKDFNLSMVMSRLSRHFQSLNQDFGEFLALKGMFNIPMVRYPHSMTVM